MTLPLVPTDSVNEKQHRTVIATALNELIKATYPRYGNWTPVVRGSGTAGTYEIASHSCRYTRIGRRVFLDLQITMAAALTGGGTGDLTVTGLPFAKIANSSSYGPCQLAGPDFSTGTSFNLAFRGVGAGVPLWFVASQDNGGAAALQISGIAANDELGGSICYETDDP